MGFVLQKSESLDKSYSYAAKLSKILQIRQKVLIYNGIRSSSYVKFM